MPDFLMLMHRADGASGDAGWEPYLAGLRSAGRLQGGSAIGAGLCVRRDGASPAIGGHLTGFLRVGAADLDDARTLLAGNPVYEAGGTIELRELPRTGGGEARPAETDREAARFEHRALGDALFRDCAMARSRFEDVDLAASRFTDVNLRGATFDNVNLAGVRITDAAIDGLTIFGHDIQALIRAGGSSAS